MDYKKAIQKITSDRRTREAEARLFYLELLRNHSDLYETEKAIRGMTMDEIQGKKIDKNSLDALKAERNKILSDIGVTNEMLDPPYNCAKCHDTGLIGGKPCSCVIKSCAKDGIEFGFTFENSNIGFFPKNEQARILKVYETAKIFCDKFPQTKKLNLIFMGRCGSGKTFLASCIASAVLAKGYSVIMLSSFAFVNRMLKFHTTFDGDKLSYIEPLMDCDLLILDDLGSENMLKNVTVEYLFHVVNERMNANKHTVFTTNLDDDMIRARYGERTYSRLFGSRLSAGFALSDTDLRSHGNL